MDIRNIAIIAHVDHGKTTLVNALLKEPGAFRSNEAIRDRAMDSNPIEHERGITILAKTTSVSYENTRINIVDTPGHSDFAGEVERIMGMVDGCLLLVDAYEGTMPQTRFVLKQALEHHIKPVVVINKVDRANADPEKAVDETLDLFIELGADESLLDFPVVYVSALNDTSSLSADPSTQVRGMKALLDTIVKEIPAPKCEPAAPLAFQCALLDYNDFVGRIAIGTVRKGSIKLGENVSCYDDSGNKRKDFKVMKLYSFEGMNRIEVNEVQAGDICGIAGYPEIEVSNTVNEAGKMDLLPPLRVDEPTLQMEFGTNSSPLRGQDGKLVTARVIEERLFAETQRDVSLRYHRIENKEGWIVSGRGAELKDMDDNGTTAKLVYVIPSRGLIGFVSNFLTLTKGYGIINHVYKEYRPMSVQSFGERPLGVLVSVAKGEATGYALEKVEEHGTMFIAPGETCYEGMIVGEHRYPNDLAVNCTETKPMNNIRSSTKEQGVVLKTPRKMSLEACLDYIDSDELVEITPHAIRMRKKILNTAERKKFDAHKKWAKEAALQGK